MLQRPVSDGACPKPETLTPVPGRWPRHDESARYGGSVKGANRMPCFVPTSVVNIHLIMNFFPVPPTIQAELFLRIPDEARCIGETTDWKAASSLGALQDIFLEVSMKF
jgi:hypothetical protein